MATPEQIARIHELRELRWTPNRIGERLGLDAVRVREVLGMPLYQGCIEPKVRAAIQAAAAEGKTLNMIKDEFGISRRTAQRVCASVERPKLVVKEAKARAGRIGMAALKKRRAEANAIPAWIPVVLRDTYENVKFNRGEIEAAAVVRRMKASGWATCR